MDTTDRFPMERTPDFESILRARGYKENAGFGLWTRGDEPELIDINSGSVARVSPYDGASFDNFIALCGDTDDLLKAISLIDCRRLGLDINAIAGEIFNRFIELQKQNVDDDCIRVNINQRLRDTGVELDANGVNALIGQMDWLSKPKNFQEQRDPNDIFAPNPTSTGLKLEQHEMLTQKMNNLVSEHAHANNRFEINEPYSPVPEPTPRDLGYRNKPLF